MWLGSEEAAALALRGDCLDTRTKGSVLVTGHKGQQGDNCGAVSRCRQKCCWEMGNCLRSLPLLGTRFAAGSDAWNEENYEQ